MILPLRRRHRWMILTIGILVLVLYSAALLVREPSPTQPVLPAELSGLGTDFLAVGS